MRSCGPSALLLCMAVIAASGADNATADWTALQQSFPAGSHLSQPRDMKKGTLLQLLGSHDEVLAEIWFYREGGLLSYEPRSGELKDGVERQYYEDRTHEHQFEFKVGRRVGHELDEADYATAAKNDPTLPKHDRPEDYLDDIVIPRDYPVTKAESFPKARK